MSRGDSSSPEVDLDTALDSGFNEDTSMIGQTSRESAAQTSSNDSAKKNDGDGKSKRNGLQKVFADIGLFDWLLIVALLLIMLSIAYLFIGIGRYGYFWEQPWLIQ